MRLPNSLVRKLEAMRTGPRPACAGGATRIPSDEVGSDGGRYHCLQVLQPGAAIPERGILPARRGGLRCHLRAGCGTGRAGMQEFLRVLRHALHQHLEMQVRAGGTAGGADLGDLLAAAHEVAALDEGAGGMGVAGDQLVAVVDLHHVAVGRVDFLRHDHAAGSGQDGRAGVRLEVQPRVQGRLAGEGIDAPAEGRAGGLAEHGLLRGHHVLADVLVEQAGLDHGEQVHPAVGEFGERVERVLQFVHLHRPAGDQRPALPRRAGEFRGRHARQAGDALAEGFQLQHARLHLADLAGHGVEVGPHEAVALGGFVPRGQPHQGADHRPALPGTLEEHPVVEQRRHEHHRHRQQQPEGGQAQAREVDGAAARQPGVRDNQLHFVSPRRAAHCPMNRRHHAVTLLQATEDSPTLARLASLTRDSSERLRAVELLIPATLRPAIQAGPIEGATWCLLVRNNAAAAKVRQLLPALQAHLRSRGWEVNAIRLKIQT